MDAKLKEDLFRRYVTALERRLEEEHTRIGIAPEVDKGRRKDSEALLSTATALLGAYQPDPGQRFRMVNFYEVVENSLRCQRGGNLKSLEKAFHTLEVISTNLLLFPWKKEFRCIKVKFKLKQNSLQISADYWRTVDSSMIMHRKFNTNYFYVISVHIHKCALH